MWNINFRDIVEGLPVQAYAMLCASELDSIYLGGLICLNFPGNTYPTFHGYNSTANGPWEATKQTVVHDVMYKTFL